MIIYHVCQVRPTPYLWHRFKSLFMYVYLVCKVFASNNSTRLFYPNTSYFPPSYICLHILLRLPFRLYIRLLLVTMLFLVRKKWEISHKPKLTRDCSTLQADGVIISRQIHLSCMKFLLPTPIHFLQKNKFS